jgi:hypothetical protein
MIIRRGAFNNKAPKITRRAVDMGMRYGLDDPRVIAQSHVVDKATHGIIGGWWHMGGRRYP